MYTIFCWQDKESKERGRIGMKYVSFPSFNEAKKAVFFLIRFLHGYNLAQIQNWDSIALFEVQYLGNGRFETDELL